MEAMLGQSRRGVNPRSGQVTVQTQPPLAEQETNPTSAPNHLVFLEKAECVRSFSAELEDDRRGILITGLATDKEHMFVVDRENNRIFTHEGQFKFDIKVNKPFDVAVSQTGHLYITSPDDRCVQVYSTRGQQVTTMGQGLLGFPQVNSVNDNIVISDMFGHCVHVLSPTGDHLYQYDGSREGSELRYPHGVCTDSYGHIFIADWDNTRIVALSPQGQFIRYIVTKDDGLKFPWAVVINPAGQLVVAEVRGNVKTFKYTELKQGE
ncbi:RING finger protein nhl-1-like [Lingula anatina]|uniref:RING finger protein nhl-1-like n=1 Tax=Lingula anatina TaxID=7574 RepID=A0A2R2MSY2_LINAN|nr:RING finger protein nhl-1-like [Lingula anatina]|eukprot:XP_023933233.1 RING finger protein nhl-1-like [Lingula anatina]